MVPLRGVIADIDGVVVDSPHERAWRESLRALMEGEWSSVRHRTTWAPDAFTHAVYQQVVAGRPRLAGARAALEHFGVPDADRRAPVLAAQKDAMITRLIDAGGFRAHPDALRFLVDAKDAGMRLAAASSSQHARALLARVSLEGVGERSGLSALDLFDVDVSGRAFARGKPDPEMFLTAAAELGVAPGDALVLEDAPAGITAARAAGMVAVGIARGGETELLASTGADVVVTTLDEIDRAALRRGVLAVAA